MSFGTGVRSFLDGARLLRRPGLRRYVWTPALVSLAVISAGLYVAFGYLDALASWMTGLLPAWLDFLGIVVTPIVFLFGFVLAAWLFAVVATWCASPFLSDLSLAVERADGGPAPQPPPWWAGIPATLARELRKLAYHLPRLVAVLLLSLIPVVNAAAPLIWFVLGAWIMAVQFCDYPTENRRHSFPDTLVLLRGHRAAALGFGCCVAIALAIPVVSFLFVPAAVAGGTLLWRRLGGTAAT